MNISRISSGPLTMVLLLIMGLAAHGVQVHEIQTNTFQDILSRAQAKSEAKQWAEAAPLWEKVVQINPVEGEFWSGLAEAYYHNKQYREAIPAYQSGLRDIE